METLTLHFHCGNRVNLSANLIVLVFSLKAEQMTRKDIFSKQLKAPCLSNGTPVIYLRIS